MVSSHSSTIAGGQLKFFELVLPFVEGDLVRDLLLEFSCVCVRSIITLGMFQQFNCVDAGLDRSIDILVDSVLVVLSADSKSKSSSDSTSRSSLPLSWSFGTSLPLKFSTSR